MAVSGSKLQKLFRDKPESVIHLPEWLLPRKTIEELRSVSRLAIVEIAGRDSIAAAIKSAEEEGFSDLIPTYCYTSTEYGSFFTVPEALERLKLRLPRVRIHDLLVMGSPGFWRSINGYFISELFPRFGFFTTCIGCHLYLHSVRIPLAVSLGNVPIISGERELHNDRVKINQTAEAMSAYQALSDSFGIRLILPLKNIQDGSQIEEILGLEWEEDKDQLGCVLSGNYRPLRGNMSITRQQIKKYLGEFALPCASRIIQSYCNGKIPDHISLAREVLESK